MGKTISWLGFFSVLIVMVSISGCIDDAGGTLDITAPEIQILHPLPGSYHEAGGFIEFESLFKDDLELGSYSIDVHDNLDGHEHGRIAGPATDPELVRWSFKRNYSIPAGMIIYVAQHDDNIDILPNAIAGPYHFIVQAVDMAGNATSFQDASTREVELYITNDSQPLINIVNLIDSALEINVGTLFRAQGDVTDPTTGTYAGIHSIAVILGEGHEEEHQHESLRLSADDLINTQYESPVLDGFMIDNAIILDLIFEDINFTLTQQLFDDLKGAGLDHLVLSIEVRDEQGNLSIRHIDVHFSTA